MTETPLISVVMPAYNAAKYLREAVESVLAQTEPGFELLVFDDGSDDATADILREYARRDERVHFTLCEHQGYSPLLNMGVQSARGEFLARMDADDICEPTRFAKQIGFLRSRPDVIAVGSAARLIDGDGDEFSQIHPPVTHEEIEQQLISFGGGVVPHPSLMVRTSAIRSIHGYCTEYEPAEDLDLLLRLAEIGRLANIEEPLLRYRVHSMNVSQTKREKQQQEVGRILRAMCVRRGITTEPSIPTFPNCVDGLSATAQMITIYERATRSGQYATALKYAIKACKMSPMTFGHWLRLVRAAYTRLRIGHGGEDVRGLAASANSSNSLSMGGHSD